MRHGGRTTLCRLTPNFYPRWTFDHGQIRVVPAPAEDYPSLSPLHLYRAAVYIPRWHRTSSIRHQSCLYHLFTTSNAFVPTSHPHVYWGYSLLPAGKSHSNFQSGSKWRQQPWIGHPVNTATGVFFIVELAFIILKIN